MRPLPITDGGPIYTETRLDRFIVEPFNAFSAALFLGVVAYWLWELKGKYRDYLFLTYMVLVLGIGGVGGVLYHAFRVSEYLLMMDYVPITICCMSSGFFFLWRTTGHWLYPASAVSAYVLLESLLREHLSMYWYNNTNYFIMAMLVLLPTFRWMHITRYVKARYVWLALGSFSLALGFRIADRFSPGWLTMGTHWLWHVFGAATAFLMIHYVYLTYKVQKRWEDRLNPDRGGGSAQAA